ncbi:MAG: DUF559 domain-containing protein [Candidatus Schekmanbacteria bacterium]|nr:DUF559 domain-containing protein [Candidatus Schekmanbacteria bacterium]
MAQQRTRTRSLRTEVSDAERLFWARLRRRQLHGDRFRRRNIIARMEPFDQTAKLRPMGATQD